MRSVNSFVPRRSPWLTRAVSPLFKPHVVSVQRSQSSSRILRCSHDQFAQIRRPQALFHVRHKSTSFDESPPKANTSTTAPESRLDRDQVPAYELTFTCTVCSTRSSHRVSKQGYHHGTVLISCPGCKNRHLISDNMKIFTDQSTNIEDIMREKGNLVKRGTLGAEGDLEFWEDGTTSTRSAHFHHDAVAKSDKEAPEGRLTEPPVSEKTS